MPRIADTDYIFSGKIYLQGETIPDPPVAPDVVGDGLAEEFAELKNAVDKIGTLPIENKAKITELETELTELEVVVPAIHDSHKTISSLYHEADSAPNFDLPDWRFWHHLHREARAITSTLYYRAVGLNDAILLNQSTYQTALTQDLATQVSPGNYLIEIDPGVNFTYTSSRTSVLNGLSFPAGVYGSIVWHYIDSAGAKIRTGERVEVIGQTETAHGLGLIDAPSNATGVRTTLYRADSTSITYEYSLA